MYANERDRRKTIAENAKFCLTKRITSSIHRREGKKNKKQKIHCKHIV
jgi:hypothetical protein